MFGSFVFLGSAAQTIVIVSLTVAGLAFLLVLYNQMRIRTVTFRRTVVFPIALFVIALSQQFGHVAGAQDSALTGLFAHGGASVALFFRALSLALVFGLARGLVTEIWSETDGTVLRRGGLMVGVLWLLTLVCRSAIALIAHQKGVPETVTLIWLEFAVTILAQNTIVMARANRAL
jgi:hypothetical protein